MCLKNIIYSKYENNLVCIDLNIRHKYFPIFGKIEPSHIPLKNKFSPTTVFTGYKLFKENYNETVYSRYNSTSKLNEWYQSNFTLENDSNNKPYLAGFHILATREDARQYKKYLEDKSFNISYKYSKNYIYKVEFKDILGFGYDADNTRVILASKMRVLGRVK